MEEMRMKRLFAWLLVVALLCVTFMPNISILAYEYPETLVSKGFVLPDIVPFKEALEHNYVGRVTEEEKDLYTYVFLNSDGSHTMRVYSHPVKYYKDDTIQDISLKFQKDKDGYMSFDHPVSVRLNNNLIDGVSVSAPDVSVNLIPDIKDNTYVKACISADSRVVEYKLNDDISYEYMLTCVGVKEDIVVKQYTGQSDFFFRITTNGLCLKLIDGVLYLTDEKGDIKASMGDVYVTTADEKNNKLSSMTYETIREKEEYMIKISLDKDFLEDDNTVYPIRIDPSIEVNYNIYGAGAIEDVTINSLDTSDGSSGSLYVGNRSEFGKARILMRFPNLNLNSIQSADNITSAYVELRDLLCESESMTVYCYPFTGNSWTESNVGWNSVSPNSYGSLLSSNDISYNNGLSCSIAHRYSFSITNAAKGWRNGTYDSSKGLIFKASDSVETGSYINKTFASYNRSEYKPSLTIDYTSGGNTYNDINLNNRFEVNILAANNKQIFRYVPSETGFYSFYSFSSDSENPKGYLYNSDMVELKSDDNGGVFDDDGNDFMVTYHLIENVTYYFGAGFYGDGIGTYDVWLSNTTEGAYVGATNTSSGATNSCAINNSYVMRNYSFIANASTEHLFFSSDSNCDSRIWLYDEDLDYIGGNDDSGYNGNYKLNIQLQSGHTYYVVAGAYGSDTGVYTNNSYQEDNLNGFSYYFKNIGSQRCIDIEGPSAQEWVHQWTYHTDYQEKWRIVKYADGYYTIRSDYGDNKLIGISQASTGVDNIKLYTQTGNTTKWKIYKNSEGIRIFVPRNMSNAILVAPDSYTGTRLRLCYISNVGSYSKWNMAFDLHLENFRASNRNIALKPIGKTVTSYWVDG
jgi:hypothetical protein